MAQFDSLIIFSLIWSMVLILISYYKLFIGILIPHFAGVQKFAEKKLTSFNDFQIANSKYLFNINIIGV
jgi:hypothetical protein